MVLWCCTLLFKPSFSQILESNLVILFYESHWNDCHQAGGSNLNILWNIQIYTGKSRSCYLRFALITNAFCDCLTNFWFPTLLIWLVELQIRISPHLWLTKKRILQNFFFLYGFYFEHFQFIDHVYPRIPLPPLL